MHLFSIYVGLYWGSQVKTHKLAWLIVVSLAKKTQREFVVKSPCVLGRYNTTVNNCCYHLECCHPNTYLLIIY